MTSLDELQVSFPFVFFSKNSSIDIVPGKFESGKVDQGEVLYCKSLLHDICCVGVNVLR